MRQDIVVAGAVRTAIGKFGGTLKDVHSGHLASAVIKESLRRAGVAGEWVNEVIMGEARQSTESSNVARNASLRAGLPVEVTAFTVNRLCASGMQAVASGALQIMSGHADIVVAGGTENMSRTPIYLRNSRFGEGNPILVDSNLENGHQPMEQYGEGLGMGMTAEHVAERYGISRADQDEYAWLSQQRAENAIKEGRLEAETMPLEVRSRKQTIVFREDEHPRFGTTPESLQRLQPVFKPGGTVTAGNACGRNDGAAAMVLTTRQNAIARGVLPLARIVDWAVAGVSPEVMGTGPVPAIRRLLARTGLVQADIGLFELNEAFASQALYAMRELKLDPDRTNVNGGGIALGHPLGATGARIITTLLYEMRRRNEQYGVAALCVGGGQGMAILLELL